MGKAREGRLERFQQRQARLQQLSTGQFAPPVGPPKLPKEMVPEDTAQHPLHGTAAGQTMESDIHPPPSKGGYNNPVVASRYMATVRSPWRYEPVTFNNLTPPESAHDQWLRTLFGPYYDDD